MGLPEVVGKTLSCKLEDNFQQASVLPGFINWGRRQAHSPQCAPDYGKGNPEAGDQRGPNLGGEVRGGCPQLGALERGPGGRVLEVDVLQVRKGARSVS